MSRTPDSEDFARAFGDTFDKFLKTNGISQSDAANRLGWGKAGKARLNTYCHDSPRGIRRIPEADVLYLVCVKLNFEFEYKGFRVSAATFNGNGAKPSAPQPAQLEFEYAGQFELTNPKGTVSVSFKRPPGRVELAVSLEAAS
jgi:hypothetical protein